MQEMLNGNIAVVKQFELPVEQYRIVYRMRMINKLVKVSHIDNRFCKHFPPLFYHSIWITLNESCTNCHKDIQLQLRYEPAIAYKSAHIVFITIAIIGAFADIIDFVIVPLFLSLSLSFEFFFSLRQCSLKLNVHWTMFRHMRGYALHLVSDDPDHSKRNSQTFNIKSSGPSNILHVYTGKHLSTTKNQLNRINYQNKKKTIFFPLIGNDYFRNTHI